jgi:hypothetical protein
MTDEEFRALVLEAFKVLPTGDYHYPLAPNQLRHFAALVAEAEREAILAHCEAVCKAQAGYGPPPGWMQLMDFIRARGSDGKAA